MPLSSFSSALTGLNNNAQTINLISNNLANLNTTAFKAGRASFAELVGAITGTSDNGNPIQPGLGSTVSGITQINTQGSIQVTGRASDAAINGNGFFVVDTGNGQGFTRSGNFGFNSSGELITVDGLKVLGYLPKNGEVGNAIDRASGLSAIVVPKGSSLAPKATEQLSVVANLDSRATAVLFADLKLDSETPNPQTDPPYEATTPSFSTGIQVVDSLGATHVVTVNFYKIDDGAGTTYWAWDATIPAEDIAGFTATDPPVSVGQGGIGFTDSGKMSFISDYDGSNPQDLTEPFDPADPWTNPTLTIADLKNGAKDMEIKQTPGAGPTSEGFGLLDFSKNPPSPRITAYAADSNVSSTSQNGYQSSALRDISIGSDGTVAGFYENGKVLALAQIALATFPNADGLAKLKGSTFIATGAAGEPAIGTPGSGGRGSITGSALEGSNVDIAQEFTNLIIAQRGYQANSRVISATDQIYQETVNLVR